MILEVVDLDKIINEAESETGHKFSRQDTEGLRLILKYLNEFPNSFSWRSRSNIPNLKTSAGIKEIAKKFIEARNRTVLPQRPKTIPDPVVFLVMQEHYGVVSADKAKIEGYHLEAMSSENIVGGLLEKYIDSVLREIGWVWCSGDIVRSIDFIKNEKGKLS